MIYGDLPEAVEITAGDGTIVQITLKAPPPDNAYPNNPVHFRATMLSPGAVQIKATAQDADPARASKSWC